MLNKGLLSSNSNEWATPQVFYNTLDSEFHFTLDPCATKENAKCKHYYTEQDNGLTKSWDNEIVFCNPPYGRAIKDWVKKATEIKNGIVVMLIPARTDTKYFHDYIYNNKIQKYALLKVDYILMKAKTQHHFHQW